MVTDQTIGNFTKHTLGPLVFFVICMGAKTFPVLFQLSGSPCLSCARACTSFHSGRSGVVGGYDDESSSLSSLSSPRARERETDEQQFAVILQVLLRARVERSLFQSERRSAGVCVPTCVLYLSLAASEDVDSSPSCSSLSHRDRGHGGRRGQGGRRQGL